jgi:hypothetical protein
VCSNSREEGHAELHNTAAALLWEESWKEQEPGGQTKRVENSAHPIEGGAPMGIVHLPPLPRGWGVLPKKSGFTQRRNGATKS